MIIVKLLILQIYQKRIYGFNKNYIIYWKIKKNSYEITIKTLQSTLKKEQKRVRELKNLYIKEIESKSEMEKILRKCIDDIKDEMLKIKAETRLANLKKNEKENAFAKEQREILLEKLLNNEKVLTIIYDKTFYSKNDHEIDISENDGNVYQKSEEIIK